MRCYAMLGKFEDRAALCFGMVASMLRSEGMRAEAFWYMRGAR
jgi:hypothetical protein